MSVLDQLDFVNKIVWGNSTVRKEIFKRWCQGFCFSDSDPCALEQMEGGPCAVIATLQAGIIRHVFFNLHKDMSDITKEENFDLLIVAMSDILSLVHDKSSNSTMKFVYWSQPDQTSETSIVTREFSDFIQGLLYIEAENELELQALILSLQDNISHEFGLLCFLYSVLLTYDPYRISNVMENDSETLIDPIHGHASQCLINLLITGRATPYLFDGERDLGLEGIASQPNIGFLTIFEASRYCEVGWYLKNPAFPIWVLGSETHFTVLASNECRLVHKETSDTANKMVSLRTAELEFIKMSNGDESGFIMSDKLCDLLTKLSVEYDEKSLQCLKTELDPENLGLILREPFMQRFYPTQMAERQNRISEFCVLHINALQRSNLHNKVKFHSGSAKLIDPEEELVNTSLPSDRSDIQRCLETKWPTIKIKWDEGSAPSIN